MHPVGFFFSLQVGWRVARSQYVLMGNAPYSAPAVHCLLLKKKKKRRLGWGGVRGRGFVPWGHCRSEKEKKKKKLRCEVKGGIVLVSSEAWGRGVPRLNAVGPLWVGREWQWGLSICESPECL